MTIQSPWPVVRLGDICDVNPRLEGRRSFNQNLLVSFVPMAAVDEVLGSIISAEPRNYNDVSKGYTAFRDGDVLFARITPCMENGKAAIAEKLNNGIGFGSTEFHILRPSASVLADYIFFFVRQPEFRRLAKANFTGTAGQQRVPADFVKNAKLPLPPLEEQRRIVDILNHAASIRRLRDEARAKVRELVPALFVEMFGDPATNPKGWATQKLGNISKFISGGTLPVGEVFKGQEHGRLLIKVGDMNIVENDLGIRWSREWSDGPAPQSAIAPSGSVVFPKRGGAIATNKKRILLREAVLDPNLMAVVSRNGEISSPYLYSWFLMFDLSDISSGTTVPQLNKKDLEPLIISIPPLALQQQFADRVAEIEATAALADKAAAAAEQLTQSLLSQVFGHQQPETCPA